MPGSPYGGFTLQLEVTPDKTGDLDMSIEWIGTEDGESGTIELSGFQLMSQIIKTTIPIIKSRLSF